MVEHGSLRRRAFLLEPGDSLLLADSAMDIAMRYGMWENATGLTAEQTLLPSPLVTCPLVSYPTAGHPARAYPNLNPAMLWLPLLWLPDRVAGRYQIQPTAGGPVIAEDDDTWAIRVALELSASGLYDVESGTWLDVLALHGLDIDDPLVVDRLARWQAGAPDTVLDAIDLSSEVDVPDTEWALDSALALLPDLRPASWALMADDLVASLDEVADPTNPDVASEPSIAHRATATVVTLARTLIDPEAGAPDTFWDDQLASLDRLSPQDVDGVIDGPLAAVCARLYEVRDTHWPHLDALEELGADGATPAPVG